jgi:phosphoribosyl 1,2-cyclic phosphodiesterase/CheY-like chemotaxis protein
MVGGVMRVRFFGTRGSIPTPGPNTVRYGGNTACVEVTSDSGTLVILDIGTGAFALGQELKASGQPIKGHVLISHTHWDHIQGLPFFAPFFAPGNEWDIYAPRGLGSSLRETLSGQMQYTYFPVTLEQLGATIRYHDLVEGSLTIGDILVEAHYLNHPALTLGYRLTADGASVVYASDHEPHSVLAARGVGLLRGQDRRHAEFIAGADLVIHDGQFVADEYTEKVGWGHSTIEYALKVSRAGGVKRLALTHHDPLRTDDAIDSLVKAYQEREGTGTAFDFFAAAEGQVLRLSAPDMQPVSEERSQQAVIEPAMVGHTVLIAMNDDRKVSDLKEVLEADHVDVLRSDLDAAPAATDNERPSLLVLEDTGNTAEIADTCAAVRQLGQYGRDLPIILVTKSQDIRKQDEFGISDRLVEPYSENYARTRFRAWLMRSACRWMRPPIPEGEEARLDALYRLGLLDTPREERFDRLTQLAARALDAPIAAITLIDRDRQWFKSIVGLDVRETPRDESFCSHVVYDGEPMVVPDARLDPRFADNPQVANAPYVRFYAGHPLTLSDGHCIGSLCIVDIRPRELDVMAREQLRALAEIVREEVERGSAG